MMFGFVVGGAVGSLHQMLTRRPASFHRFGPRFHQKLWAVFVIVFAGPFIIMRNALRGRLIEGRPAPWLALSTAIATGWSFASGVVLLQLVMALQERFAA
jgi:hypothetical protein